MNTLPPNDVAAEEAVIAAFMLDEGQVVEEGVPSILRPIDFFREHNGWIYDACLRVNGRGDPVTVVTVAYELEQMGKLDEAGGEPYLVEIVSKYFTAVGVSAHARIIVKQAFRRRLISSAQMIASLAYADTDPARAIDLFRLQAERAADAWEERFAPPERPVSLYDRPEYRDLKDAV